MTRGCERCGTSFSRKRTEASWRFKMRRYCSRQCYAAAKTQPADAITERVRRVLEYDPDLELWAICERFGVDHGTARRWVDRFLGRQRRPLLHHPKKRPDHLTEMGDMVSALTPTGTPMRENAG